MTLHLVILALSFVFWVRANAITPQQFAIVSSFLLLSCVIIIIIIIMMCLCENNVTGICFFVLCNIFCVWLLGSQRHEFALM